MSTPPIDKAPRKSFADPVLSSAAQDRTAYLRLYGHISRVWIEPKRLKTITKWNAELEGLPDSAVAGASGRLRFLIVMTAIVTVILETPVTEYKEGDAGQALDTLWGDVRREDLSSSAKDVYYKTCFRINRIERVLKRKFAGLCPHCGHEAGDSLRCQICRRFLSGEVPS